VEDATGGVAVVTRIMDEAVEEDLEDIPPGDQAVEEEGEDTPPRDTVADHQ